MHRNPDIPIFSRLTAAAMQQLWRGNVRTRDISAADPTEKNCQRRPRRPQFTDHYTRCQDRRRAETRCTHVRRKATQGPKTIPTPIHGLGSTFCLL